jgi:hypothetical protein
MPLAKKQCEVGRRVVGLGSSLPKGRNIYQCCSRIEPAEAVNVVLQDAKILRPAFADDQVGGCDSIATCRSILGGNRLAIIEIGGERRRPVGADAGDIRAEIGEQASANGGGEAPSNLYDSEAPQQ